MSISEQLQRSLPGPENSKLKKKVRVDAGLGEWLVYRCSDTDIDLRSRLATA